MMVLVFILYDSSPIAQVSPVFGWGALNWNSEREEILQSPVALKSFDSEMQDLVF